MKKLEEKRSVIYHQLDEKERMLKLLEDTRDRIIIKKSILDLGTKFTRLQVPEIIERCKFKIKGKYTSDKIGDYERKQRLVVSTINNMIGNKEIYAEFFYTTGTVVFNQQANIDEIDRLMDAYKDWEKKEIGRKIN